MEMLTVIRLLAFSAIAGCVLAGCISPEEEVVMDEPTVEGTYVIAANTKLRYDGNLEIGVGNFWMAEYVDERGDARRGVTAGLWLVTLDGSLENQHVRVGSGQELIYGAYRIRAVEVDSADGASSVRLEISAGE